MDDTLVNVIFIIAAIITIIAVIWSIIRYLLKFEDKLDEIEIKLDIILYSIARDDNEKKYLHGKMLGKLY